MKKRSKLGTAVKVRDIPQPRGKAALFRLNPPLDGHKHVICSGVHGWLANETMVFGADAKAKQMNDVSNWGELAWPAYGIDIPLALKNAGYRIVRAKGGSK